MTLLALLLAFQRDTLPDLPRAVQTPLGPVAVQLVPNLHADSTKVWGVWYWGPMLIRVEAKTTKRAQWLALFHEECHVALDASGLAYLVNDKVQEALCDATASERYRATFG